MNQLDFVEDSVMGSILQSTMNTRALPTGTMRYIREHPEVDIDIIIPHRENMKIFLKQLQK